MNTQNISLKCCLVSGARVGEPRRDLPAVHGDDGSPGRAGPGPLWLQWVQPSGESLQLIFPCLTSVHVTCIGIMTNFTVDAILVMMTITIVIIIIVAPIRWCRLAQACSLRCNVCLKALLTKLFDHVHLICHILGITSIFHSMTQSAAASQLASQGSGCETTRLSHGSLHLLTGSCKLMLVWHGIYWHSQSDSWQSRA